MRWLMLLAAAASTGVTACASPTHHYATQPLVEAAAAEPESGVTGTLIARVGENGLEADVEGLTIYEGSNGRGYLIASSQGSATELIDTSHSPRARHPGAGPTWAARDPGRR